MRTNRVRIITTAAMIVYACSGSATTIPDVVRVEIAPLAALVRGGTASLRATAWDSNGRAVPNAPITWESRSPAVISVDLQGVVTGVAPGTGMVVAHAGSVSGSIVVHVTDVLAPEPAGSDVMLWQDDFESGSVSQYATRGDMRFVGDGHSGQALRFIYTGSSYDNLIEKVFSTTTDIYFRYWYRLSPGADPTCGNRGGSGMKWFMPWRANTVVRYTMGVGNLDGGPPSAQPNRGNEFTSHDNTSTQEPNPFLSNVNKNLRFSTTNDGQWHKYTLHVVTGNGGYEQIWVDGALVLDNSAYKYDHDPAGIAMVQFPGTLVQWFSGCDFTIDVDDLAIWHK